MALTPRSGVGATQVLEALVEIETDVGNLRGLARDGFGLFNGYLGWANTSAERLGYLVRPGDIERLVLTRRHWTLQTLDPAAQPTSLHQFVALEIDERKRAFESEIAELRRLVEKWSHRAGTVVVPDTNVLVHHPEEIDEIDWAGIVASPIT